MNQVVESPKALYMDDLHVGQRSRRGCGFHLRSVMAK